MSFHTIDMQIAVQRNMDASNMQNQLAQKPVMDQSMLASAAQRAMEQARHKSAEVEKSAESAIRDRQGKHSRKSQDRQGRSKRTKGQQASSGEEWQHPYKGRHIDISL